MPRPCKRRCVSSLPNTNKFGPLDKQANEIISMGIEEYEVIKLIDLEKLTQNEAADKLDVSRATVQSIYKSAREKLAKAIVEVKTIHINGGNYKLVKHKNCKKKRGCCNENSSSK